MGINVPAKIVGTPCGPNYKYILLGGSASGNLESRGVGGGRGAQWAYIDDQEVLINFCL